MSHLAVLTARPDLPICRELESAAATRGHALEVLDTARLAAQAEPAGVLRDGQPLPLDDLVAVLPRVGNWRPDTTLALLETMAALGVASLNGADAIRRGRDHWATIRCLAAAGIPHPRTVAGADPGTLAEAAAAVCGFPCVVKQRRSRQGVGVIRCGDRATLDAVLDSLWRLGDEVVVQRFCPPGGVSRRVLVLLGEVIGATEHLAVAGEFRANAARGGSVRVVSPDAGTGELAVAAAALVGLGFAGVDLLPDGDRWVVGEVNPTPGWTHFQAATGVRVADRVVTAMLEQAGRR